MQIDASMLFKDIKEFINIDSSTGNTSRALKFIRELVNKNKLEIIYEKDENVIIRKKDLPFSGIIFSGHYDTVRPFFPIIKEEEEILRGRGVADMKSSVICMIYICMSAENKTPLVALTSDEETDSDGAILLNDHIKNNFKDQIKGIVVGEPTSMKVCDRHSGRSIYELTIYGDTMHASRGNEGNLIYILPKILGIIDDIPYEEDELLGKETLTPVSIRTSPENALNVTPESISFILDRRKKIPLRSYKGDILKIRSHIKESISGIRFDLTSYEKKKNHTLPYFCDDDKFKDKVLSIVEKEIGLKESFAGFTATCDASWFSDSGPVVICGPGDLSQAHTPEESIRFEDIKDCIKVYKNFIKEF